MDMIFIYIISYLHTIFCAFIFNFLLYKRNVDFFNGKHTHPLKSKPTPKSILMSTTGLEPTITRGGDATQTYTKCRWATNALAKEILI